MDANDLNDAPDETVEKGQGHDQQASPSLLWLVKPGQAVSGPFRPRRDTCVTMGSERWEMRGEKSRNATLVQLGMSRTDLIDDESDRKD